ncbi:MAG: hypothetical protein AABX19_03575 [Nanoarchaeota archaeon]
MAEQGNEKEIFIIAIVLALGIILKKAYDELIKVDWHRVFVFSILIIGLIILLATPIVFIIKYKIKQKKKLKEEQENISRQAYYVNKTNEELDRLFGYVLDSGSTIRMIEKLEELRVFLDKIEGKNYHEFEEKIDHFFERYNQKYKVLLNKQKIEIEKQKNLEEKREQERKIFEKKVNELLEFKKKHNSSEAVPINHKYDSEVLREAHSIAVDYFRTKEKDEECRKEAIEYYKIYTIETKPIMSYYRGEMIYEQVRNKIKEGKINIKKIDGSLEKLEKNFYRAKDLDDNTRRQAIGLGYKYVRGNELDGKVSPGGFYINKTMERESDYHFYMKNLFAEINNKLKIEYCIENKRVDVSYIDTKFKIGIEIETGTNKTEQLIQKVQWLNKHFDKWIIVCTRKNLPKYNKYVDNKKSYCLTPKLAKEKLKELIATMKHQ